MPQANEALQPEYRGEQVLALAINLERELRGDEAHLTACAWPNCWSSWPASERRHGDATSITGGQGGGLNANAPLAQCWRGA